MKAPLLFAAKYLVSLGGSFYVHTVGFLQPRHRVLINSICAHFGYAPRRVRPELPEVDATEIAPEDTRFILREPMAQDGNVSLFELIVLARIVAARNPQRILEIGTFDGRTTLNLASNSTCEVLTLDLPASDLEHTTHALARGDKNYIRKTTSGARFLGTDAAARITQLWGDSATFDWTPYVGTLDLIFIDGAHSREYVLSDSRNALRLLKPDGGIILWHDYDGHFDGVTEAIHILAREGHAIRRVAGTNLACLLLSRAERPAL